MRRKIGVVALAGVLGIGGFGAVVVPAIAATDDQTSAAEAVGNRLQAIKDALAGLVSDGTITQEQADAVAETLDEQLPRHPHGGRGHGPWLALDTAAEALGMTAEDLRAALQEGQSLADVAAAQDVEVDTLVRALVEAAEERLAQAVEDGRLTQQEADEKSAELEERIAVAVEREGLGRGPGHGLGHGFGHRHGEPPAGTQDGAEPGESASPSGSSAVFTA